jgi:hypothetical protein
MTVYLLSEEGRRGAFHDILIERSMPAFRRNVRRTARPGINFGQASLLKSLQ